MFSWECGHEFSFDGLDGVVFFGEGVAASEALDVGVYDEADVDVEGVAQDDVCGFSCDAFEFEEFVHGLRDLAGVLCADIGHG